MKFIRLILMLLFFTTNTSAQKVKDFTLSSVTDNSTFTLSKSKGEFIALHFLLKTECPYCIRHTSDYIQKSSTLPNVIQVFIKPDSVEEIKKWADKMNMNSDASFPIYQDLNAKLADDFNIPSGYAFHGQIVHYPALILLNKKRKEVFRYVGKNNADRFSFEDLRNKIQEFNVNQ